MTTLYMNNSGTRYVVRDNEGRNQKITLETKSGNKVTRRVKYFETWGNFCLACISYKGKLIKVFTDQVLED